MSREEARKLYEGKFFYEIVKEDDHLLLCGPFDNILYVNPDPAAKKQLSEELSKELGQPEAEYAFVQVVNGQVATAFEEHEILVTDRKLGNPKQSFFVGSYGTEGTEGNRNCGPNCDCDKE